VKAKIICILVMTLLITTAVSATQTSIKNTTYENCGCCNENEKIARYGIMREQTRPIDFDGTSTIPIIMDTPDYFNWMDFEGQDWTTPAKNQYYCGSCWLFSAIGALDSVINIREGRADLDVDLSEQYVLSCLPRAGNCTWGGWPYVAYYYIWNDRESGNNCNGIIPESCFPYKAIDADGGNDYGFDNEPVLCEEKCENWEDYLIPISDFGRWYPTGSPEDIDAIKTQIMQNGPVATSMFVTWHIHGKDNFFDWGWEHHDPEEYYSTSDQYPGMINHGVVIVGWKDDSDIVNGGYWICKNSWDTDWGYNGFFNIEYGCLNIDSWAIAWVDYNPDVDVNWLPNANAGGIYYSDVGQEITFDASDSFDHEGEIISYEWEFGDGNHGSGITAVHTYESQGAYPLKLIVVDNDGNTANDTSRVFVGRINEPPNTPTIDGPTTGGNGIEYTYKFSTIDPEGDDVTYLICWGEILAPEWYGPYSSGEEIELNYTWMEESEYIINVKAKDEYGFKSDWGRLEITMPKDKQINSNFELLNWFFEQLPNAFPILKYIMGFAKDSYNQNIFDRR